MHSADQSSTLSVSTVSDNFTQWRQSGVSRHQTPTELRQQALSLLAHYPKSEICSALNIPHSALKNWISRHGNDESLTALSAGHDNGFVSLPLDQHIPMALETDSENSSSMATLNICLSNGTTLTASLSLDALWNLMTQPSLTTPTRLGTSEQST